MIALWDGETPSPQLMNEWVKRFVSNVTVHRETEKLHMTVQFANVDEVLYEKYIVAEM